MAVHIPLSAHCSQKPSAPIWRSSSTHPLQTPANVSACFSLPTLAALPSCPTSLPAAAPPSTRRATPGRVWHSFLPLEQKGTRESANNAITSHAVHAAPESSELQHSHHKCPGPHPAGMSRKHGMLSREVCSPSLQKYVAQGSTSRRSSKCHRPFLAWLYNISNIKYYL